MFQTLGIPVPDNLWNEHVVQRETSAEDIIRESGSNREERELERFVFGDAAGLTSSSSSSSSSNSEEGEGKTTDSEGYETETESEDNNEEFHDDKSKTSSDQEFIDAVDVEAEPKPEEADPSSFLGDLKLS